jgi:serine protease Do
MNKLFRRIAAPAVLVTGIAASATMVQTFNTPVPAADAQAAQLPGADVLASSFRQASQTALRGVVYVQVEAAPRQASQQMPFQGTPFEEFFRGQPAPRSQAPQRGSGSGFIISPDGYIMTNNHVVENATRVTVQMTDRREFNATVVGRDPNTDVAVLKIDGENLPTVKIGNSSVLDVGDWVLALGYPLSLGETVTAGIISAKGRSIGIMQRADQAGASPVEHFIQTDAAINPGNSGGPLVNLQGEAIGMNTAIASTTGTYTGYGFAVPIELAKRVADDLIRYGSVRRPKLGVQISATTPADVEVFKLSEAAGAVVRGVQDGPARDAGIQLGDVIVAVDGQPIRDDGDLLERVALRQPGERVALDVIRYGARQRLNVELGAFDNQIASESPAVEQPERNSVGALGFAAAELTPALARQLGIRDATEGVVVTEVDRTSGAPTGLVGLRIERVNGQEIRSVDELRRLAAGLGESEAISVIGRTQDGEQTIINYRLRQ